MKPAAMAGSDRADRLPRVAMASARGVRDIIVVVLSFVVVMRRRGAVGGVPARRMAAWWRAAEDWVNRPEADWFDNRTQN
ncbi:hypothetical protein D3C85_1755210 [compost metagenome]